MPKVKVEVRECAVASTNLNCVSRSHDAVAKRNGESNSEGIEALGARMFFGTSQASCSRKRIGGRMNIPRVEPLLLLATLSCFNCAAQARNMAAPPTPANPTGHKADSWCVAEVANATEKNKDLIAQLPPQEAQGISGAVSDVSALFREAHQRARAEECRRLATARLVIRYSFGTIEARFNGTDLGPRVFFYSGYVHALKSISHAVFLAALLFREANGPERDSHVAKALQGLEGLRGELQKSDSSTARLIPPDEISGQMSILTSTMAALRRFQTGKLDEAAQHQYFDSVRPLLNENLIRASRAVLRKLHETVAHYKSQVDAQDPAAWKSVVVVAAVSHQSRSREIGVQYFERLVGETMSEGASRENRLVVVEASFKAAEQRGALAAHDVDREHASWIFNDPSRLQWDVMADSGGLIDAMLPPPK
jgi:hypothetical protein